MAAGFTHGADRVQQVRPHVCSTCVTRSHSLQNSELETACRAKQGLSADVYICVCICMRVDQPKESKYPIFKDSGPKNHQGYALGPETSHVGYLDPLGGLCLLIPAYMRTHVRTHVRMSIYMSVYIHVCRYIYIYISVCISYAHRF